MLEQRREIVEKHIKTHSARSVEDCDAVTVLNSFLRSDGKINEIANPPAMLGRIE